MRNDAMTRQKVRITGTHKKTGKKLFMSYATHNGQTFCSFNPEPTQYKYVEPSMFLELQLLSQSVLQNIRWELLNEKTVRQFNIGARADRVSSINSTSW